MFSNECAPASRRTVRRALLLTTRGAVNDDVEIYILSLPRVGRIDHCDRRGGAAHETAHRRAVEQS